MDWLLRLIGIRDIRSASIDRTLRGLRTGDQRELYSGLSLAALAYLRATRPRRRLIFSKKLPEGSALVIHHRRSGDPKIQVVKPPNPPQTR
ncbi:MAG TPA: hypothetical protein VE027_11255 [Acidimicrobiia bacterium]|jgi:hypothetical protein|nr:hypothetical protein [Acidimicrobiia bacterium]HYJ25574.1 hypothetical protein [Acidimicrobiia bacterium]